MNLASILDETARRRPHRLALELGRRATTFTQLQSASMRVCALLARAGVEPGDRVVMALPNVPEFAAAYFGILRVGAVAVPLSTESTRTEIAAIAADAQARCVLAWRDLAWLARRRPPGPAAVMSVAPGSFFDIPAAAPAVGPLVERSADDTATILYTSGSAGEPKGVELTHANLAANARVSASLFGFEPADALLGALPLFHCFGQTCVLNAAVVAGASVLLVERFDPERVERLLRDGRVSVFIGVPSMFAAIASRGGPRVGPGAGPRLCVSGGAPLREAVLDEFEHRFGCTILEGYGLTETSPVASFNRPGERKAGSIGTPVDGVQMRIVDGEILIRGHNVMKGYWRRPDETAAVLSFDGWLRSGDLGRVDERRAQHLSRRDRVAPRPPSRRARGGRGQRPASHSRRRGVGVRRARGTDARDRGAPVALPPNAPGGGQAAWAPVAGRRAA